MSSITARIPWPNPLTSTLGFSLNALRLTFHILPQYDTPGPNHMDTTLAESVASIAESFIHEEMTPQEETKLWGSVHPDLAASAHSNDDLNIPGGLDVDPFLLAPEEAFHLDSDPPGVSLFTTLIERLLARFEFDAVNTEITLVHPGNMSITISITDIRYQTEGRVGITEERRREGGALEGEARTISISGVTITALDLQRSVLSSPSTPSMPSEPSNFQNSSPIKGGAHLFRKSFRAASPASSTSSMDEETQFAMSQSLAFLPPHPVSPTGSNTSSMYQSVMSTAHTFDDMGRPDSRSNMSRTPSPASINHNEAIPPTNRRSDSPCVPDKEAIMTFGVPPIMIQLTTDHVAAGEVEDSTSPQGPAKTRERERLHLAITCGVIACALRGWHVRGIIRLAERWTSLLPQDGAIRTTADSPSSSGFGVDFTTTVDVRGIVMLTVFPLPLMKMTPEPAHEASLTEFFERPLVPPTLSQGYLRIHLDNISGSLSAISLSEGVRNRPQTANTLSSKISIHDFSIFSHNILSPTDRHSSPYIWPVIISDHGILSQYPSAHSHPYQAGTNETYIPLPTFEIVDWTDPRYQNAGTKLSSWRTTTPRKASKGYESQNEAKPYSTSPKEQHFTEINEDLTSTLAPAISITINKQIHPVARLPQHDLANEMIIKVVPLHTFIDLGLLLDCDGILSFLDDCLSRNETLGDNNHRGSHGVSAIPPSLQADGNWEGEERPGPVLEDLDLEYDPDIKRSTIKKKVSFPPFILFPYAYIYIYIHSLVILSIMDQRYLFCFKEFGSKYAAHLLPGALPVLGHYPLTYTTSRSPLDQAPLNRLLALLT
jgi:autophagy-related protein 2